MKTLAALAWTFLHLSFLAVGGGLSAIPEMQRQVVSLQGWLTARQFVDGFALSQLTPGPAMLVTTFIGYRVHGVLGAVVATAAMFLPTSLLTLYCVHRWGRLRDRPWAAAVERALPPLSIGLVSSGVYAVGKAAVTDLPTAALAAAAVLVLSRRWAPAVAVVLAAGVANVLLRG